MKIGFFLPNATFDLPGTAEVGGIEVFTFTVGEAMRRAGHDVVLFGGRPKPGRSHAQTGLDLRLYDYIETKSVPDLGTRFQRLVQRLHFGRATWKDFLSEKLDAVILSKPFDWPVAWCWKRRQPNLRVVMGFHGEDYYPGDRLFYGAVDAAFAVSKRAAALAERRVKCTPVVIPNPVDTDFFTPGEPRLPLQDVLHVVASGRLVGWKGFHVLIEAIAVARREGCNVTCELAGDGPEAARLKEDLRRLDLEHVVRLHGALNREEIRAMLLRGDVYVLPSVGFESFSIAALEGASTGLPLILTDQVALADFLDERDRCVLPAGDVAALAAALRRAAGERTDAGERLQRHERVRAEFSAERISGQIMDLIGGIE